MRHSICSMLSSTSLRAPNDLGACSGNESLDYLHGSKIVFCSIPDICCITGYPGVPCSIARTLIPRADGARGCLKYLPFKVLERVLNAAKVCKGIHEWALGQFRTA